VDYITATFVGRHTESSLQGFGKFLVQQEVERGEKWREFRFSGYRGEQCGSAAFGVRPDSCVIRLSSKVAAEHWNQAYSLCTNVTRLDVQVTSKPHCGPQKTLLKFHKQLRRKIRGRGRPASFKFWYGPAGPEAAILGKRCSEWFGRIYDKGIESRLPEYEGHLRHEAEVKGDAAKGLASQLDQHESVETLIMEVVHKFVTNRGLRCLQWSSGKLATLGDYRSREVRLSENWDVGNLSVFSGRDPQVLLGTGRQRRRAIWLTNSVKPAVQELLALGQEEIVLKALGLSVESGELRSTEAGLWSSFNKWR